MRTVWSDEAPPRLVAARALGWLCGGSWRVPFGSLVIAPQKKPVPLPGGRWVRVRNRLAGIAEGDLTLVRGRQRGAPHLALPHPPRRYVGREVVGEVIEVGLEVSLFRVGDRVTLQGEMLSTCETLRLQPPCRTCSAGNVALCEHRALPWQGSGAGWSSEMLVHESQIFSPPDDLTDEQALLLEPAARAIRALLRQPLNPGTPALVIGGGAIAQLIVAASRAMAPGIALTVATDHPYQIAAMRRLEVAQIIPRRPAELFTSASHLTNAQQFRGRGAEYLLGGFDVVFDCEGTPRSLDDALRLACSGGTVILAVGYPDRLSIDPAPLWQDEVSILGIGNAGTENMPVDLERSVGVRTSNFALAARLMRQKRLRTDTIVTHRLPGNRLLKALDIAARAPRYQATRVIITHDPLVGS